MGRANESEHTSVMLCWLRCQIAHAYNPFLTQQLTSWAPDEHIKGRKGSEDFFKKREVLDDLRF